jgi:multiple sugar transport system substrate-binding protein
MSVPFRALGLVALFTLTAVQVQSQSAQVELSIWGGDEAAIRRFEQLNPGIKVNQLKVSMGAPYYDKLLTALKAGNGPDIANVEYQMLPTVISTGKLLDIGPLGLAPLKRQYEQWMWNQVSFGGAIYGMPVDAGPMALMYRADLFKKAGAPAPTSWAAFADAAAKLKAINPSGYIASFASNDPGWFTGLAWQAGARWFKQSGDGWEVKINDDATKRVGQFWQGLIEKKFVKIGPAWNDEWYGNFQNGNYATWPTAAWGPGFLESIAPKTTGAWRVALLPVWEGGKPSSGNWGGTALTVTKDSKHPKEAAKLVVYLGNKENTISAVKGGMYPALNAGLESAELAKPFPFLGNQKSNLVFRQAQRRVDPSFQWGPTMTQVYRDFSDQFGLVATGQITLPQAIDAVQASTVTFMKKQGFNVK